MKKLKVVIGVVFVLLLFQGVSFVNLMVSSKHEVSVMGSHIRTNSELSEVEKNTRLEEIKKRSEQIEDQKRNTKVMASFLFVTLLVLCGVWLKRSNESDKIKSLSSSEINE